VKIHPVGVEFHADGRTAWVERGIFDS
jgi:hypothetical protein